MTQPARNAIEIELATLAQAISALAERLTLLTSQPAGESASCGRPTSNAARVRQYLRARRLRERLLPAELFADPAWDMLLDLYASEFERQRVSISSACIAAAVPATTALRWLARLEELALIERQDDPHDSRRSFVRLTTNARECIEQWISQSPIIAGDQPASHGFGSSAVSPPLSQPDAIAPIGEKRTRVPVAASRTSRDLPETTPAA